MVLNKLMFLATIHLRLAFADLLLVHTARDLERERERDWKRDWE